MACKRDNLALIEGGREISLHDEITEGNAKARSYMRSNSQRRGGRVENKERST